MKKILLSALLLTISLWSSAYDVEINGVCYDLNRNEREAQVSCLHYHLGEINWSGIYRFAPQSNATGEECYAVPMDVWERLKTETFYATIKGGNPSIYLTNGWWSTLYTSNFITPGNELLADNGDGTWTLSVNFEGDQILELLDERHLLFTGSGYSVENIYLKDATTDGSDDGQEIVYVWKNGTYQSDEANIPEKITYEDVEYTVTSIGESGLSGFYGLNSVTIPYTITSIANNVFLGCSNLVSVKVDSKNVTYDSREDCNAIIETSTNKLIAGCQTTIIPNSVTSIGDFAFNRCSGLTSITIPSSVTTIGESAFAGTSLADVEIPNSVTSIGVYAFGGCSYITSVNIPNSVTSIGEWAFSSCTSLSSVIIPNEVKRIGDYTFAWCWSLASVVIPSSVTNIGAYAFEACRLENVYCYAPQVPETFEDISFQDATISRATLHVPAASINDYMSTSPWNGFMNIVALTDDDPGEVGRIENESRSIDNQPVYNSNGQRVSNAAKGLLIKNGKKYFIR